MSWEQRNGRSYYYSKAREGGRVRSKYVGSGRVAQICADLDNIKQRERNARRDADIATRQAEAEINRQLAEVESTLAAMTHATLFAAGCHKHKGQWRKKRLEKAS